MTQDAIDRAVDRVLGERRGGPPPAYPSVVDVPPGTRVIKVYEPGDEGLRVGDPVEPYGANVPAEGSLAGYIDGNPVVLFVDGALAQVERWW